LLVARVSPHLKAPTVVTTVALTLIAAGCATSAREARRRADERPDFPYVADQGDGTYRNPIIFADYSDPDVIRDGDAYYLISSSFTSTPALPILRSRDLVNWTIVGHAMENLPDARYAELQPGAGVWAPAIRAHAGTFFIFVPLPDEGIYVLTAPRPEGPWSAPRMLIAGRGLIDPTRDRAPASRTACACGRWRRMRRACWAKARSSSSIPRAIRPSRDRRCTSATAGTTSWRPRAACRTAGRSRCARGTSTDRTKIAWCSRRGTRP
jgi:hypothetical protein